MTDSTGRARGNPAPRPALARFRPQGADDPSTPDAAAPVPDEPAPSAAAAPGGTEGRDLLIPGRRGGSGAAKPRPAGRAAPGNGRGVPSLADLMPPAAPAGRRHGGGSTPAPSAGGTAKPAKPSKPTKAPKGGKGHKGGADDRTVDVVVPLPKPVRKKLKARAAELGLSPEDTVAQLVQVWLEG